MGIKNIGVGQGRRKVILIRTRITRSWGIRWRGGEDAVHASGGDRDDCGIGGQQEYLEYVFPKLPIYRIRYRINPTLIIRRRKEADLLHAAEKRGGCEASAVHAAIPQEARRLDDPGDSSSVGSEGGGDYSRTAGVHEFGHPEGFGLPPAEAMASEAIVIGYDGRGGSELDGHGFRIEMGTFLAMRSGGEGPGGYSRDPARLA